jgi:transcriptional regulator with XRE-family HTH domain
MGRAKKATPQKLSEKLKAIRNELGLTFEELIKALDCPEIPIYRASISQYESGKIEPPLPILLKYARLANIIVDILIDDELDLPTELPSKKNLDDILKSKLLRVKINE